MPKKENSTCLMNPKAFFICNRKAENNNVKQRNGKEVYFICNQPIFCGYGCGDYETWRTWGFPDFISCECHEQQRRCTFAWNMADYLELYADTRSDYNSEKRFPPDSASANTAIIPFRGIYRFWNVVCVAYTGAELWRAYIACDLRDYGTGIRRFAVCSGKRYHEFG